MPADNDVRWVEEPKLGLWEQLYFPAIMDGLKTTVTHMFKKKITEEYPEQEPKLRGFLASLGEDGVQARLEYKALNGTSHVSAFWEMFLHVVNHGTYHRGQVQTMFRQLGATPAQSVDLIVYFREKNAAASL